jgi:hypothetical protein
MGTLYKSLQYGTHRKDVWVCHQEMITDQSAN